MIPEQAEKIQIEIYRKMSGEQKLRIAFELYEIARKIVKQRIKEGNPLLSESELNKKVAERMNASNTGRNIHKSG